MECSVLPNEITHYKNCGFLKFAAYYIMNLGVFVPQITLQICDMYYVVQLLLACS